MSMSAKEAKEKHLQRTSHRLAPSMADHMIAGIASITSAWQTSHRRKMKYCESNAVPLWA